MTDINDYPSDQGGLGRTWSRFWDVEVVYDSNWAWIKHLPGVGLYESRLNLSELYEALMTVFKSLIDFKIFEYEALISFIFLKTLLSKFWSSVTNISAVFQMQTIIISRPERIQYNGQRFESNYKQYFWLILDLT